MWASDCGVNVPQQLYANDDACRCRARNSSNENIIDYDQMEVQVQHELGEGCYGKVFQVNLVHRSSSTPAAIKVFNPPACSNDEEDIRNEIRISLMLSSHLSNPNPIPIVRTLHSRTLLLHLPDREHQQHALCTFMELCQGGNLRDFLHDHHQQDIDSNYGDFELLREAEALLFFRPLAEALQFCHSHRVLHLDVKPENILLQSSGKLETACLADFGIAIVIPRDKSTGGAITSLAKDTFQASRGPGIGCEPYVAPEVVYGGYYSPMADVWSLGAVLLEALTGCTVYSDSFRDWRRLGSSYTEMVIKAKDMGQCRTWCTLSDSVRELIAGMLCPDPLRRLSVGDVLCHAWLTSS